jgi:phthiodiolone/phenolphthiodiolone dimycocerosates ketoreductase
MLRAAGRYADAWYPQAASRPHDYSHGLEAVRTAASDAGRDPMAITPAAGLFLITGRSPSRVDDALNSDIAKAFALNIPAQMWAAHGVQHPLGHDFAGAQDLIPQTLHEQTVLSYTAQVPSSLMKEFFLTGTPHEVVDQVAQWRDYGLRYLVVMNLSILQPSLRNGLEANAPFVKILRALRKLATTTPPRPSSAARRS